MTEICDSPMLGLNIFSLNGGAFNGDFHPMGSQSVKHNLQQIQDDGLFLTLPGKDSALLF